MKAAFIGGGSLRLLPIFRGIFASSPQIFENGEIRLIDLHKDRAEAVARLVQACPEFATVKNCKVIVADETMALYLGMKYNYNSSDQLSVNGAFLSLRLGFTILNFARKMEQLCPNALMLLFPNPVSVYSHMVNTYTKIRALGICGGFTNHRLDLTRLCFSREALDYNWDVVAAGVNHLSYIIRGDYEGEDLYSSICPKHLTDTWTSLPGHEFACESLYKAYRRYGTLIFSSESDGIAQIFPDLALEVLMKRLQTEAAFNRAETTEMAKQRINATFAKFIETSKHPETVDWDDGSLEATNYYGINRFDIILPILKALAGIEKMRIVASRPNYGAIRDLPEKCAVEYTMDIFKEQSTPVADQYIPRPFYGLTASLSEYQTLIGDAIARHDNHLFANALAAFPQHTFRENKRQLILKLFDMYSDVDPYMLEAKKYFL